MASAARLSRRSRALSSHLVKLKADRNTVLIALGGGVVGDVTGFLASIYMRGIRFVQIPTTFLSQVDSSVGGKTGVNLTVGKNLVGVFKQPELVLVDPQVLSTLPDREFRSGLYESLKAGVIRNPRIFEFMEQNREQVLAKDPGSLEWLIAESVRVKADVVGQDEEEHGLRKILNFGHTIGHALEAETSYKVFLHGEAVAWGMVAAASIAVEMQQGSRRPTAQRIISLMLAYAPLPQGRCAPQGDLPPSRQRQENSGRPGTLHPPPRYRPGGDRDRCPRTRRAAGGRGIAQSFAGVTGAQSSGSE